MLLRYTRVVCCERSRAHLPCRGLVTGTNAQVSWCEGRDSGACALCTPRAPCLTRLLSHVLR